MREVNEENERVKRRYVTYLRQSKGQDQKSLDKVLAALLKFEKSTKFKSFKAFYIEQAATFKKFLDKSRHPKTKQPLSLATVDATLRMFVGVFVVVLLMFASPV